MYGFYFDPSVIFWILILCLAASLGAWLLAISLFAKIAKEKGYFEDGAGILWFMGIFATPIVAGLYVLALPDKNVSNGGRRLNVDEELPSI